MQINSIPAGGIASSVWTNATRNLTGLSTNCLALVTVAKTTLAASATLDIRPAVNVMRELTFGLQAGAAGAFNVQQWDGTNAYTTQSVTANTTGGARVELGTSTTGVRLQNGDGTNAANYVYSGADWKQ